MKKYADYNIRRKLFILYIIACLLPILAITSYLTVELVRFTKDNINRLAYSGFEQVKLNVANKLLSVASTINEFSRDKLIVEYVETQYDSDYEALTNYKEIAQRRIELQRESGIYVLVYSSNRSIEISRATNNTLEDFQLKYGISKLELSNIGWFSSRTSPDKSKVLGGYKVLRKPYMENSNTIIFVAEIEETSLYPLLLIGTSYPQKVFLLDKFGNVLSSTERTTVFINISSLELTSSKDTNSIKNGDIIKYNGVKYYAYNESLYNPKLSSDFPIPDWNILYLIPFGDMQISINKIWMTCIVMLFACVIISFIAAEKLSRNITLRLSKLVKKTKLVLDGNFNISSPITNKDEIGYLEASIYEMVEYIDNMIYNIQRKNQLIMEQKVHAETLEKDKKEAELIALRSQINPHYLFNTLESIRMNLVLNGDKETARILRMFSESFRILIEEGSDYHTLEDELDFLRKYLEVQQYRFRGKFTFEIITLEELKCFRIPKLIIQPLVENALYHGIERKIGDGKITIIIGQQEQHISIKVTDDGCGIEKELLKDLRLMLNNSISDFGKNIALKNISRRLRLIYGEEARLLIDSKEDYGTTVELSIPSTMIDSNWGETGD